MTHAYRKQKISGSLWW